MTFFKLSVNRLIILFLNSEGLLFGPVNDRFNLLYNKQTFTFIELTLIIILFCIRIFFNEKISKHLLKYLYDNSILLWMVFCNVIYIDILSLRESHQMCGRRSRRRPLTVFTIKKLG